jgi:predicted TIM-barrel enzyme
MAHGVIVGTDIKLDGVSTNPIDPVRAAAVVKAAGA